VACAPRQTEKPFLRHILRSEKTGRRLTLDGVTFCLDEAMALVEEHRKFDCPHYGVCLDYAVEQDWKGWVCP
jgi:hypothetical protein